MSASYILGPLSYSSTSVYAPLATTVAPWGHINMQPAALSEVKRVLARRGWVGETADIFERPAWLLVGEEVGSKTFNHFETLSFSTAC